MICSTDITRLKSNIFDKIGQKIIVKGTLGRNKSFEKEATIDKAYPSIFKVKYNDGATIATTFSYTDILTRTVEVQVLNDDNIYCPLIPPPQVVSKKRIKI